MVDGDCGNRLTSGEPDSEAGPELVGAGLDRLPEQCCKLACPLDRVENGAVRDHRVERAQAEREGGCNPKVRAGAAQAPEELGVLVLARAHEAAVRRHELDFEKVVNREPVPSLQPAHPAAKRQSGDAGVRHHPYGTDEPVRLRPFIELGEKRAPGGSCGACAGINVHASHPGEVDHDSVIAGGEAGDAVAAAPDGDEQILIAGVPKG